MNLLDFVISERLAKSNVSLEALIGAVLRRADSKSARKLKETFPDVVTTFENRSLALSGVLPVDGVDTNDAVMVRRLTAAMRTQANEILKTE